SEANGRGCYTFVAPNSLETEHTFERTCVLMKVDARGGLWLDDPLLVFGLLTVLWVLVAWLSWDGDWRQLGQGFLDRLGWVRVVQQRAGQVRIVGAHIKMAMARQVEQNDSPFARLSRGQRLVDGRANRVRRFGRRHDA